MATRLLYLFIALSFTACGKSPWADYVKEGTRPPSEKANEICPLLDANQIKWIRGPFNGAESEFEIQFLDIPQGHYNIELWMPSMGHGSAPVKVTADPHSLTHYFVSNVYFIMAGDWEIRIKAYDNVLCIMKVQIP